MAENEINRGEVWWISGGMAPGSTQMVGRPAVIINDTKKYPNAEQVSVVYTSKQPHTASIYPCVQYGGDKSWVLCSQIATVGKNTLNKRIAKLSDQEMSKIERALREVLCLGEKTQTEEPSNDVELIVERDMYKRLYEKTLEMLVNKKSENDLKPAPAPVVRVEPVPEPPKKYEKIDLNQCSIDDLMGLGFWYRQADDIIRARPFANVEELAEVPEIPPWLYASVKNQVYVSEVPTDDTDDSVEIFDLNTVDVDTLCKRLGFQRSVAENIVAARPYKKVADLRVVPGVTRLAFQLVENRVTVVVPEPEPEPVTDINVGRNQETKTEEQGRTNINTATWKDLVEQLGMSACIAYSVTGYRNKNGNYKSVDELLNVARFTKTRLENIRDKVCV